MFVNHHSLESGRPTLLFGEEVKLAGRYIHRARQLELHVQDQVNTVSVYAPPRERHLVCLASLFLKDRDETWQGPQLVAYAETDELVQVREQTGATVLLPYVLVKDEEVEPVLRQFVTTLSEKGK